MPALRGRRDRAATDLLIAACAFHHGAELEHEDSDFDAIARVAGRGADG